MGRHRDGSTIPLEVTIAEWRDARGHCFHTGIMRDVTARQEAEAALMESEGRFRRFSEVATVSFWTVDEAGAVRMATGKPAERSHPPVKLMDTEARQIGVHPDDHARLYETWRQAKASGSMFEIELRIGHEDNSYRWTRMRAYPDTETGSARLWYGMSEDIHEQKEAQERLGQVQEDLLRISRLSAMGAMASTLAHELNQPLTAIANYLAAGRRRLSATEGPDPLLSEAMDEAASEALRAGEIIRRIRKFTMTGEVSRKAENISRLVEDAWNSMRQHPDATGVQLICQLDTGNDRVEVDPVQLEQVIANILRNSIEAMRESPNRRINVSSVKRGEVVELRIADTGPGLSAEAAAHLFEPFRTTKARGTGLGLPICRTIIEAHGGRIWAEPSPRNAGAEFVITLPVEP